MSTTGDEESACGTSAELSKSMVKQSQFAPPTLRSTRNTKKNANNATDTNANATTSSAAAKTDAIDTEVTKDKAGNRLFLESDSSPSTDDGEEVVKPHPKTARQQDREAAAKSKATAAVAVVS